MITPPQQPEPRLPYLAQLDGLRGFAVLAVLVSHWVPGANAFGHLGLLGVYVFFVLSGFLITRILLGARAERDDGVTTNGRVLVGFYGRRVLRIFPAYYLAVIGSFLLWPRMFGDDLAWNLGYLSNMRAVGLGRTTAINHFWSLAVEEQFYLVWPFLVLLVPQRHLAKVLAAFVVSAPLWRVAAVATGHRHIVYSYPVWSNLDCLGAGALLAVAFDDARRAAVVRLVGVIGTLTLAVCGALTLTSTGGWLTVARGNAYATVFVLFPLGAAMVGTWLVARGASARRGVLGGLLTLRPMRFIGIISYGVYVYHFFVQGVFDLAVHERLSTPPSVLGRFCGMLAATLLFATVSWLVLERPAIGLKRFFPYDRPRARGAGAVTACSADP